jgi:hypothetical protein
LQKITIHHSKKKVFDAIKHAANNLDLEIKSISTSNYTLSLFSSGGLFSYGNNIDITVTNSGTTRSIVEVSSQSVSVLQVIDWGTNLNLENKLLDELNSILES